MFIFDASNVIVMTLHTPKISSTAQEIIESGSTLAATEQEMENSTSTSILVGSFLKLMAVKCLSSDLERLKVNW